MPYLAAFIDENFYEICLIDEYNQQIPYTRRFDLVAITVNTPNAPVVATRGCPYHCRYCSLKQIHHDSFRARPVEDVIEEISLIPSRFFVFWDDNFFADRRYAISLMKNLVATGKNGRHRLH
jgi:radical SAM superfamily enzyme YgiQ (UPF0313 family)